MVLMLVDHAREFFFLHRQVSDPMQLGTTAPDLFLTRLVSHLCAPAFVLLTGLAAALYATQPGRRPAEVSAYLVQRGLLLMALEITVINFAWTFELPPQTVYLQVIWAIGLSMLALALLLHLPLQAQVLVGLLIVCGHNLLDSVHFKAGEPGFVIWAMLHDRGWIEVLPGIRARTSYPVLPWIGVMLLGYALGSLYRHGEDVERRHTLVRMGVVALCMFVLLRVTHGYGDQSWTYGSNATHTVLAFFNVTKYPPSLHFLLLTLGVSMIGLGAFERIRVWPWLTLLGRVPLFFYVAHLYALHLFYLLFASFKEPSADRLGFEAVWQLWLMAGLVLLTLYLPCRWYARVRESATGAWTRYF